jgi:rhodanese-related sulfurtransferase
MDKRRFMMEAATIVLAAIVCALVANALASRERSMALVGDYPNAGTVPSRVSETFTSTPSEASRFDAAVTATAMNAPSGAAAESGAPLAGNAPMTSTAPSPSSRPAQPASTTAPTGMRSIPATAQSVSTATAAAKTASVKPPAPVKSVPPAATPADPVTRFPPHDKVPYVEIAGDDVAWLHQHGVLFLDARRTSVYEQGHIAGARPFSVWESDVDDKVKALLAENRDQKQPIVIYCSGGDCEDSHMLAQKLWGVFFNNVYVYKDGFPDWQKRGGPARTGAKS